MRAKTQPQDSGSQKNRHKLWPGLKSMTYQAIIPVTTGSWVSVPHIFMVIQFCLPGWSFLLGFIATLPVHSHLFFKTGKDFKSGMARHIWSAIKNAVGVCKWVGEFCMAYLRSDTGYRIAGTSMCFLENKQVSLLYSISLDQS